MLLVLTPNLKAWRGLREYDAIVREPVLGESVSSSGSPSPEAKFYSKIQARWLRTVVGEIEEDKWNWDRDCISTCPKATKLEKVKVWTAHKA